MTAWSPRFGARLSPTGVDFSVWSGTATQLWVSIFDEVHGGAYVEIDRQEMRRGEDGRFSLSIAGLKEGARYGFRADGPYQPERGDWFDPNKLLTDPYALQIDHPYRYHAIMAAPRWQQDDTAPMMPKSVVVSPKPVERRPPVFAAGGLIYEINVRGFTMRHPNVPMEQRGTIGALAHPAVIAHLKRSASRRGADADHRWIDERHLPPLAATPGAQPGDVHGVGPASRRAESRSCAKQWRRC